LIVEVHTAPEEVHSDGAQAITPDAFAQIRADAAAIAALDERELVVSSAASARR
jgi:3-deoxy-D-arabino-heptulosonate 7-phosphate (DAHP) synthase